MDGLPNYTAPADEDITTEGIVEAIDSFVAALKKDASSPRNFPEWYVQAVNDELRREGAVAKGKCKGKKRGRR